MSTRSNIVIKKLNKETNELDYCQLYHHHDGYPEGVGAELQEILNEVLGKSKEEQAEILATPLSLGNYIEILDTSYENETRTDDLNGRKLWLHGDIEYLYTIDLDKKTITCYEVYVWGEVKSTDEEFVNGKATKSVTSTYSGMKFKESIKVYRSKFNEDWSTVFSRVKG